MKSKSLKAFALAIAGAGALMLVAAPAQAAGNKCRASVAKESGKLTQTIAKLLQKCEAGVAAGKVVGPCPDAKSATSITNAKAKLKTAIGKACAAAVGQFALARCPAADGGTGPGTCTDIFTNTNDGISDCLSCLADENATELVHTVLYSKFIPGASKDIQKCQAAIGKGTAAYYLTKAKALGKCQAVVLGGKAPGPCPDAAADASIAKALAKNDGGITKACCGDDGVCGGGQCVASPANVVRKGCTAAGAPAACCTGFGTGTCTNADCTAAGVPLACCTGAGTGTCVIDATTGCEQTRNCFRCIAGPTFGAECQTNGECGAGGRCANGICNGGTAAGNMCQNAGDCPGGGTCDIAGTASICAGGANNGKYCLIDADCLGGTCNKSGTAYCQSDDFRPVQDIGVLDPCPGLNKGAGTIGGTVMGQTVASLLQCVDTQASDRAECQDKAGSSFAAGSLINGSIPGKCSKVIDDCNSNGGTVVATVALAGTGVPNLGGVSVNVGFPYNLVQIPGGGSDATQSVDLVQNPFTSLLQAQDASDTVTIAATPDLNNNEFFTTGDLFTIEFTTCGAAPTSAQFPCVVQSASDVDGNSIVTGLTCTVTVP